MPYSPQNAYARTQREGLSDRAIESSALLKCAALLEEAGASDVAYATSSEAVKSNQKLWTLFQIGLTDPENPLPREIKVNLLNLSRYVDKQSLRFLEKADPSILKGLIFINRNLAAGLQTTPSASEPSPDATAEGPLGRMA